MDGEDDSEQGPRGHAQGEAREQAERGAGQAELADHHRVGR
jgi:hypothetical protein